VTPAEAWFVVVVLFALPVAGWLALIGVGFMAMEVRERVGRRSS
jgi:hypothetical protein